MDMPQTQEKTNEDGTPQTKNKLETDKSVVCRKRKRSVKSSAKLQKPIAAATAETRDTDSDEDASSVKVFVTNQRARRLDSFEAALDNFINYHIEIEQADEDRVIILRQTMTRIYEILRSSSYYAGALAFHDVLPSGWCFIHDQREHDHSKHQGKDQTLMVKDWN